ncbi:hypothetical protein QTH25_13295 [Clostridium perfringens]|uniref:hypothetical protein n=1 Tax=Clostridium perfringens TaxID=1502 RepID=UPI00338F1503|nr:hypothetical protein [Clostridium perfringens]
MKLKDNIDFKELEKYGFIEDPDNCEEGEHYYGENNYYYEFKGCYSAEFRLVVNIHTREFEILTMSEEYGLIQLCDLDMIVKLIKDGLVE